MVSLVGVVLWVKIVVGKWYSSWSTTGRVVEEDMVIPSIRGTALLNDIMASCDIVCGIIVSHDPNTLLFLFDNIHEPTMCFHIC